MSAPETQRTAGLIEALKAAIDEDERIALAARGGGEGRWTRHNGHGTRNLRDEQLNVVVYDEGSPSDEEFDHIARHDPQRTLAMVAAHREILDLHRRSDEVPWDSICDRCGTAIEYPVGWPCDTVLALAKGYRIDVEP